MATALTLRHKSGQALIEWVFLLPLYVALIGATAAFGEWFVIRHQMIAAVRLGGFLYSSGRLTAGETRNLIEQSLAKGYPRLSISPNDITIGRSGASQARLFHLDEVKIVFRPGPFLQRWKFETMEEKCVIKHAPSYWQTEIPGANLGPPVPW